MKPILVVLAAGMGSRYGGVKQMDGFGPHGEWLLEYSVYDAINAGFGKVVFILREAILEEFKAYFEARLPAHIEREYVLQELDHIPDGFTLPADREKPWGTGHAMLVTQDKVDAPFAIINADDFYGRDGFEKMAIFLSNVDAESYDFSIMGYWLRNTLSAHGTVNRGICTIDAENSLKFIEEHTKIYRNDQGIMVCDGEGGMDTFEEDTAVSMNFFGFTPAIFKKTEEYFIDFLTKRIQEEKSEFYIPIAVQTIIDSKIGNVKVLHSNDSWFGVTYQEDAPFVKQKLKEMHARGFYPDNLWA